MREKIDCFLPCSDLKATFDIVSQVRGSKTIQHIFLLVTEPLTDAQAEQLADCQQIQVDSLSSTNYIPAIYQMAFTYGWYSDSVSVNRKRLLGIDIDEQYMPRADRHSNEAVALFTRIVRLNDSTYADINANASYRLACYYVMPNNIYKPNYEKGKEFLLRSKEWATLAGDKDLLNKIERGLASFH